VLVAGLLGLSVILLRAVLDVDSYRPMVAERASAALGREVRIGRLDLSLRPLGVRADDVALAALPDEGGGDLLTARRLRIGARLGPLLRGRLEVTSLTIEEPIARIERLADDTWNIRRLIGGDEPDAAGEAGVLSVGSVEVIGGHAEVVDSAVTASLDVGRLTLRLDRASPAGALLSDIVLTDTPVNLAFERDGQPVALALHVDNLTLDTLPDGDAVPIRLDARILHDGRSGAFRANGTVGPLGADLTVDLTIDGDELPLAALAPILGRLEEVDTSAADVSLSGARLTGTIPALPVFAGTVRAGGLEVRPTATADPVPLSFEGEVAVARSASSTTIAWAPLAVDVAGQRLRLEGEVVRGGDDTRIELRLAPTRVGARALIGLAALAGHAIPIEVTQDGEVEIEARVDGRLTSERAPPVSGRLRVTGVGFAHPMIAIPLESVTLDASLVDGRLDATFAAKAGTSDLAGALAMADVSEPTVTFDLRSERVDLDALMGAGGESAAAGASTGDGADRPLRATGDIAIGSGRVRGLEFSGLRTTLRYDGGRLQLEPLAVGLYDGRFRGSVTYDARAEPGHFDVDGRSEDVQLAALLAGWLGPGQTVDGRLNGELRVTGPVADRDALLAGVRGSGSVRVDRGRIGKIDVLEQVAGVAGVFGERSLGELGRKMGAGGTVFQRFSTELTIGEGRLRLDDVVLIAPDFRLDGGADVNALSATIESAFEIAFTKELSATMRREGSRAAELFWNPATKQVEMPLTLRGPLASPKAGVDWARAAGKVASSKLAEGLSGLLRSALGGAKQPRAAPPPARAAPRKLEATIRDVTWGGSFLLRDMRIVGQVGGPRLARARLIVKDGGGKILHEVKRLPEVDRALAAAADRKAPIRVDYSVTVDGKKLVTAPRPLTIRVVVIDAAGKKVAAVHSER